LKNTGTQTPGVLQANEAGRPGFESAGRRGLPPADALPKRPLDGGMGLREAYRIGTIYFFLTSPEFSPC